jgi:hypothetical protein
MHGCFYFCDLTQVLAGSDANMDMSDWARPFEFGACLWSMGEGNFCDQHQLYNCLGKHLVDSMFSGIHVSAFAYGQTGSGKVRDTLYCAHFVGKAHFVYLFCRLIQ